MTSQLQNNPCVPWSMTLSGQKQITSHFNLGPAAPLADCTAQWRRHLSHVLASLTGDVIQHQTDRSIPHHEVAYGWDSHRWVSRIKSWHFPSQQTTGVLRFCICDMYHKYFHCTYSIWSAGDGCVVVRDKLHLRCCSSRRLFSNCKHETPGYVLKRCQKIFQPCQCQQYLLFFDETIAHSSATSHICYRQQNQVSQNMIVS